MDLTKVPTKVLEKELDKRDEREKVKKEKKEFEETINNYRNREACPIVGKAYGNLEYNKLKEYRLATVTISGNMDWNYHVVKKVNPIVDVYLHNSITNEDRTKLAEALQEIADSFIEDQLKDPATIVTLVCLGESAGRRPLDKIGKMIYREWHKAAIERLNAFSKEELESAKEKLIRNNGTSHGQIKLIDEVLKIK